MKWISKLSVRISDFVFRRKKQTEQNVSPKYFVFISYDHRDKGFARWLHTALTKYKFKQSMFKKCEGLEKLVKDDLKLTNNQLGEIFLDERNMSAGGEPEEILKKNIKVARKLVVICSPYSEKAKKAKKGDGVPDWKRHWVNRECSYFITTEVEWSSNGEPSVKKEGVETLGYATSDNEEEQKYKEKESAFVLPVLTDKKEKFDYPPALTVCMNPLGVAKQWPKTHMLSDIVAGLIGLQNKDILWNWHKHHLIQQTVWGIILFLLVIVAGVTIIELWHQWDLKREEVHYYSDCVDKWGIPTGLNELTKEDIEKKECHYRFIYQGRKGNAWIGPRMLREVRHCNKEGRLRDVQFLEKAEIPALQKIYYHENGSLDSIVELRQNNAVIVRKKYLSDKKSDGCTQLVALDIPIKDPVDPQAIGIGALFKSDFTAYDRRWRGDLKSLMKASNRSSIHRITRNESGFVVRVEFLKDNYEALVSDDNGIFGFAYVVDDLGRRVEKKYIGEHGELITNKRGIAGVKFRYSEYNLVQVSYVDLKGIPVLNEQKIATTRIEYDNYGNVIKQYYLDVNGESIITKENIASVCFVRDEGGRTIKTEVYDKNDKLTLFVDNFSVRTCEYDENGDLIKHSYFGVDRKPILHKNGYSSCAYKYDKCGNLVERATFGVDGKPIALGSPGYTREIFQFDNEGHCVDAYALDAENRKVQLCEDGCAGVRFKYIKNRLAKVIFYGVNGMPLIRGEMGIAGFTIGYKETEDGRWCQEMTFLNEHELPVIKKGKATKLVRIYDRSGREVELRKLDVNGCLVDIDGVSRVEFRYSKHKLECINFNSRGEFAIDTKEKFAKCEIKNDEFGNPQELVYKNKEGGLMRRFPEPSCIITKCDRRRNLLEYVCYDENKKLMASEEFGPFKIKMAYNDSDQIIKIAFFDEWDKPATNEVGAHEIVNGYFENVKKYEYLKSIKGVGIFNNAVAAGLLIYALKDGTVQSLVVGWDGNLIQLDEEGRVKFRFEGGLFCKLKERILKDGMDLDCAQKK